jgi:ABC-type sugar transport system substrate-binding protein
MSVRVIVTGSRSWRCAALARRVIARLIARHGKVALVIGDADGVDRVFAETARASGCEVCVFGADWEKFGKRAGPLRNQEMVTDGADFCIAVHKSLARSRGTKDCVQRAMAAGIPVWLIDSDDGEPRRVKEIEGEGQRE